MFIHCDPYITPVSDCPYLPGKQSRFACFAASELNENETELLLSSGWRKFGMQFFRPFCAECKQCVPVRVRARELLLSDSLKKVVNRNKNTEVTFGPLEYSEEAYRIYAGHSEFRFNQQSDPEHFRHSLCYSSCPSLMTSYYVDGKLQGTGFLDRSENGLSTVYFVFSNESRHLSLGIFSVIKEIEYAVLAGLNYYYLGYLVEGCSRMAYKGRFHPYEIYDWERQQWIIEG